MATGCAILQNILQVIKVICGVNSRPTLRTPDKCQRCNGKGYFLIGSDECRCPNCNAFAALHFVRGYWGDTSWSWYAPNNRLHLDGATAPISSGDLPADVLVGEGVLPG